MTKIDLNCDLGESFGSYKIGMDDEVIPLISSANIGCGFHGGDPVVMHHTVKSCIKYGTGIGAHPGFPDLMGFGRRNMHLSFDEAKAYIKYQLGALTAFAGGGKIQHIKPHGSLYNMAAKDYNLARAIAEAVYEVDKNIIFLALDGSEMIQAAKNTGLRYACEVFADRAYQKDGTLVQRGTPGAMIEDETESASRIIRMIKENKVTAITGEDIDIYPQSICVHGDNPKALNFVKYIREKLTEEGIEICPIKNLC